MDRQTFLQLITKPELLSSDDEMALEKVALNFPYCQSTYILLAKASHNSGSMLANKKLKTAAAYAANRSILKKIISSVELQSTNHLLLESISIEESNSEIINNSEITDSITNITLETTTKQLQESEPTNTTKEDIANEIATNLLYWHEIRQKENIFNNENILPNIELEIPKIEIETIDSNIEDSIYIENPFIESIIDEVYQEESFPYKTTLTEVPLAFEIHENESQNLFEYREITNINDIVKSDEVENNNFFESQNENKEFSLPEFTPFQFNFNDFKNITTEVELESQNENELLLEYLLSLKKEKKKKRFFDSNKKEIQDEIIDNFIKLKPGISRVSKQEINNLQSKNKDLSIKSTIQNDSLISETLAKIMVKQNKFSSAIEMYHKLILKYPEKKTYFVGIIKDLEEK